LKNKNRIGMNMLYKYFNTKDKRIILKSVKKYIPKNFSVDMKCDFLNKLGYEIVKDDSYAYAIKEA
jgi:hypothetical protein